VTDEVVYLDAAVKKLPKLLLMLVLSSTSDGKFIDERVSARKL
jgi:hypothetical protein